jgi:mRNA turnover protein 4
MRRHRRFRTLSFRNFTRDYPSDDERVAEILHSMRRDRRFRTLSFRNFKRDYPTDDERVDETLQSMTQYERIYVISVTSMKSEYIFGIRREFPSSILVMANHRILERVLRTGDEVCGWKNLAQLTEYLTWHTGIFMTNETHGTVMVLFESMTRPDFAETDDIARETFTVPVGPLPQFTFNMGSWLHALGLPVQFENGVVTNTLDYNVCTAGQSITRNGVQLLKVFGVRMGMFKAKVVAKWESGKVRRLME